MSHVLHLSDAAALDNWTSFGNGIRDRVDRGEMVSAVPMTAMSRDDGDLGGLSQHSQLFHRPVAKHSFSVDEPARHRTKFTTVVGHGAMIAQHKIGLRRNNRFRVGTRVLELYGHVLFIHRPAIQIQASVRNSYPVSGKSNHALDEAFSRVTRVAEDDDVAAFNVLPAVDQLVDEDPLLVFKSRLHAAAFHFHRLVDKKNDEESYN